MALSDRFNARHDKCGKPGNGLVGALLNPNLKRAGERDCFVERRVALPKDCEAVIVGAIARPERDRPREGALGRNKARIVLRQPPVVLAAYYREDHGDLGANPADTETERPLLASFFSCLKRTISSSAAYLARISAASSAHLPKFFLPSSAFQL